MPAKSKAQNRLKQAVANDPKVAKKLGIPQKVGKEYASATKKVKGLPEMLELHAHAANEEKQFSPEDWEFISWVSKTYLDAKKHPQKLHLDGTALLTWLARWGSRRRIEQADPPDAAIPSISRFISSQSVLPFFSK